MTQRSRSSTPINRNGKRAAWEAVVRIPCIDSSAVLLKEVGNIDPLSQLSAEERERDRQGTEALFPAPNRRPA